MEPQLTNTMEFTDIINILSKKEDFRPISFSRWGDGEWNCILGPNENKTNCDQHKYFPSLSKALGDVLKKEQKYFLGMQNFAMRQRGYDIENWLLHVDKKEWINADIFHHASIKGNFDQFFKALEDKCILLVSPEHINPASMFNYFNNQKLLHVKVPKENCWLEKDNIINNVKVQIDVFRNLLQNEGNIVVLFCASMASNVMIDELFDWDNTISYLDMGSVFEPYVGISNRTYHKKIIENLKNE